MRIIPSLALIFAPLLLAAPALTQQFGGEQVITQSARAAHSVYAADLDGDGDVDVLSASRDDDKIAWYENLGNGSFGVQRIIATPDGAHSVYATDLDGDGDADVLSASQYDDKVAWYENLGSGNFSSQRVISTSADFASHVYATDLDGDGDPDVLSASINDDKVAWYENLGGGSFSSERIVSTSADGAIHVHAADLDGDGDMDVLSASGVDDKVAWYENLGNRSFGNARVISANADGVWSVFSTDLDDDGDMDVLSASSQDDKVAWYENLGNGTFSGERVISINADNARTVYATDLDGDGDADVLSASANDDKIAWYENLGGGSFSSENVISTNADIAISVYAADLDGDGDDDVLSASFQDYKLAWYENFQLQVEPPPGFNWIRSPVNGNYYAFAANMDLWANHVAVTDSLGPRVQLATIRSAPENDWLAAAFEGLDLFAWIGASDEVTEGEWVWRSGDPAVYQNWASGEPTSGPDEDYLLLALDDYLVFTPGLWNDEFASTPWPAIYEWIPDRVGPFQFVRAHLGQTASSSYGHAIRLGDLNNDGISEYGVSDLNLPVLDLFDGATGQPIQSFTATGSTFGIAGTSHPDITGDGIPEYAIGEPGYQGTLVNEGRVWIYSGADHSLTRTIDPPASVASDPQFGSRVLEFVDINGDGVSEFLATSLRGGSADIYAGSLTCFDGATSASIYSVDGLEAYDQFVSIADLGPDLDGDGVPEIAVGAREAFNTGDGYVSILSGATGQALRTIDGFGGINDHFGNAYCWTSDQDGDGVEDLVIGAPDNDFYGPGVGRVGVYSSGTGALIREIVPPADVQTAFGAGWRSRYLRLPDSDGDGKEEVLFAGRSVLRNGVDEGVVYVCSPTTGQILQELLCPIGPMPGFGVQSQILGASGNGGLLLVLGGSNRSGSGVSGAFVYEYSTADSDQDDDGLADAAEASIYGTDPLLFDTDGDGLGDGMELGLTVGTSDTDPAVFVPDADPLTTTDPLLADTDSGGVPDGVEDQNRDGRVDTWETDPASAADDSPAFYVSNLSPNQSVSFEAYGAEPLAVLIPAYSVRGPGPTALGIGISVNLSLPISTLPTTVAGVDGRASWPGPKVPGGISLGTPIWLQMVEIPFTGSAPRASNPILLPVGAN